MNIETNERFTEFLREKANEAKKAIGYPATKFHSMLNTDGGFKTANRLLASSKVSEGFTKLFLGKRVDLSVEALIIENEWREFFAPELLLRAEKRLRDVKYQFKPFDLTTVQSSRSSRMDSARKEIVPQRRTVAVPSTPSSQLSFSALCAEIGAPLKNILDRWCGVSETKRRAVFNVWADRLVDGKYVFWDDTKSPSDTRIGARDLRETLNIAMDGEFDTYGILCEAKDPAVSPRIRKRVHGENILVLRLVSETPGVVAYLIGEISVGDIISDSPAKIVPFASAVDDLDQAPIGVIKPIRVTINSSGYRRDDTVRQFVLKRAVGCCEYCGALGFTMPGQFRYLETHHVVALGKDGPDTVHNVIALCPHHHREAHYGIDADKLEFAFLKKLTQISK